MRRWFWALTTRTSFLLLVTALLFLLAAGAEFGRYLILLHNRTRLIPSWQLTLSDLLVAVTSWLALLAALLAAVAATGWLLRARREHFAASGRRDSRSPLMLFAVCLVPVVNLIGPGVLLTELVADRADGRALRAVRVWWTVWGLNCALVVAALAWRTADSLQVKSDGVLFTGLTDLAAAAMALLTLWVLRVVQGRTVLGRPRLPQRWIVAADPMVPVIEPISADPQARASGDDRAGADAEPAVLGQPDKQEEVVST